MGRDMTGVLQNMILSVRTEDRDSVAEIFKKKTDISLKMADAVLGALTDKKGRRGTKGKKGKKGEKGRLNNIKSVGGLIQLSTVAARLMDQVQRAAESAARVDVQSDAPPPLLLHAPNAQTVSVQQFIAAVRGKGKTTVN